MAGDDRTEHSQMLNTCMGVEFRLFRGENY